MATQSLPAAPVKHDADDTEHEPAPLHECEICGAMVPKLYGFARACDPCYTVHSE